MWTERRLCLKPGKGHIRSTAAVHSFLGYRVGREGIDPGRKMVQRFRDNLADKATGDLDDFARSMIALRGALLV